jgi:hypothetical protein
VFAEIVIKTSSPLSFAATPPPYGIRRAEGLDVWLQAPGKRYWKHDRESWPTVPGQPFHIYEGSFEEHMEAAASAASPLADDHDNKENNLPNLAFAETPRLTDGMSVMPASRYRRTSGDSVASQGQLMVTEAFFHAERIPSPYGLGGDGTLEEQSYVVKKVSAPTATSILLLGSPLPLGPTIEHQADEIDSVIGLMSSTDSVLG